MKRLYYALTRSFIWTLVTLWLAVKMGAEALLRKFVAPLAAFVFLKIGKTGYWFNQTFIPMHNYITYWLKGDEALSRFKQSNVPRWFWKA